MVCGKKYHRKSIGGFVVYHKGLSFVVNATRRTISSCSENSLLRRPSIPKSISRRSTMAAMDPRGGLYKGEIAWWGAACEVLAVCAFMRIVFFLLG